MPTNVYKQRCLTCGHPVNSSAANVGLIKMGNQPRYYHLDHTGCQEAEQHGFHDFYSLDDENILLERKLERTGKVTTE